MTATQLNYDIDLHAVRRASITEPYALYLAYAETHHGHGLVKVGVTVEPYRRLYEVYQGCPFPVQTFVWGWAGHKSQAFMFETTIKQAWKADNLRGEWFKRDFTPPEEGERLPALRQFLKDTIGAFRLPITWTDGDIDDVIAFNNTRAKPKPKPKPKKKIKPRSWA